MKTKQWRIFWLVAASLLLVTALAVGITIAVKHAKNQKDDYVTVTYDTCGGTAVESTKVLRGTAVGELPYTDKTGCSFLGWYLDAACEQPFFDDDPVNEDMTLFAGFEQEELSYKLAEYTEVFLDDLAADYRFRLKSDAVITEDNLESYVSIVNTYGALPNFRVTPDEGIYTIEAIGGYQEGGLYTVSLRSEAVAFTGIDTEQLPDAQIRTMTLGIRKEDTAKVQYRNGILTIPYEKVFFSATGNAFCIEKAVFENEPIQADTTLYLYDATNSDNCRYVQVESFRYLKNMYEITFHDSEMDEVYESFELHFNDAAVSNQILASDAEMQELIQSLYHSEGTEQLTRMLAAALADSTTVKQLGDGSEPFSITRLSNSYAERPEVTRNTTINVESLLDGLTISASLGTAKNPNFNGILISPYSDAEWSMLRISFHYEATLKNKVKIDATITVTEYLYVLMETSASSKSGDFRAEVTPISQTDVNFKILVCSADEEDDKKDDKKDGKDEKKENKRDISVEINDLIEGKGDSSNIVSDVQEMLENKGAPITLCKIPLFKVSYAPIPVVSINFNVNFVINISFAAGVSIDATVLEATTIGVTGNIRQRTVNCYRRVANGSDRYIFDFYAYGYLGVEAGIEGELTVSFTGLEKVARAGVSVSVGAYADLYGYLHYHAEEKRVFKDIDTNGSHYQSLEGGLYFEMGIFVKLKAFVGIANKEFGKEIEFKFSLLEAGDQYLYIEPEFSDDIRIVFRENEENELKLDGIIPAQGKFMDITTGEVVTRALESKNLRLYSSTNRMRVDNAARKLIAKPEKMDPNEDVTACRMTLYYRGANILFSSQKLTELNVEELKGFKELGQITVYYVREGVEVADDVIGKKVTLTYQVEANGKTETVTSVTALAGQAVSGKVPQEIILYCLENGLAWNTAAGNSQCYWSEAFPTAWTLTEDKTLTLHTALLQKFCTITYYDASTGEWVAELWAQDYLHTTPMQDYHFATENSNIFVSFRLTTADGKEYNTDGKEELARFDLYRTGVCGYDTTQPLLTKRGTEAEVLGFPNELTGDYKAQLAYSITASYEKGICTVKVLDRNGGTDIRHVRYDTEYAVPTFLIRNLNNDTRYHLAGWDTNGDGKIDRLPEESFRVTSDMTLCPVMVENGYLLSVTDVDGTTTHYNLKYGEAFPEELRNRLMAPPDDRQTGNEDSFYSQSYWRICTSDFVEGDKRTAYFANLPMWYAYDLSTMPDCDVSFEAVPGELYYYVTLKDETGGHYEWLDEDGSTVRSTQIRIAVRSGSYLGYTNREYTYVPPKDTEQTQYVYYRYDDENGNMVDFYNTVITQPTTWSVVWWKTVDRYFGITYEVYVHDENGNEISYELLHSYEGYDEDEYKRLKAEYGVEFARLAAYNEGDYQYTIIDTVNSESKDAYGRTRQYYIVTWKKEIKKFSVRMEFGNGGDPSEDIVRIGDIIILPDTVIKERDQRFSYTLAGYDVNGDGVVDYLPGAEITVREDLVLTAVWKSEDRIYYIVFSGVGGVFPDGTISYAISGKYGEKVLIDSVPAPTHEVYTFKGWDLTPTTFGESGEEYIYINAIFE